MNNTTAVDIEVICSYCGRRKINCTCGCTARSSRFEVRDGKESGERGELF